MLDTLAADRLAFDPAVDYRDLPNFPGIRVGTDGSVWSCWRRKGLGRGTISVMSHMHWHRLKSSVAGGGYACVTLRHRGKRSTFCVHQLVALAFLGPRPNGMEVAHENGIRCDNRLANLSYKTPAANQQDRVRHGTHSRGERNPHARLTADQVIAIRSDYAAGERNKAALARKYGRSRTAIRLIVEGKRWTHVAS